MKLFWLLILAVFASEKNRNDAENGLENKQNNGNNEENSIVVKIEEEEYGKINKISEYIGVFYIKSTSKWSAQRWIKSESKVVYNGCYDDEETAAHASDTLARQLMENGKQKHKLNFPDNHTQVYPEEKSSKFIGVSYHKRISKWVVQRWSKNGSKIVYNGYFDNEEAAAHASDNLARKLMENGKQKLKLNFPDEHTEIYPEEKSSKFIGVSYYEQKLKWRVQRWSKSENKILTNGCYGDEERAAHASDTLARKLMENGEQNHKLNFPDDYTEVYPEKSYLFGMNLYKRYVGVTRIKDQSKWYARRWSKNESKNVSNGYYDDEETAAHASDILARKLMENGEQKLKLNFPNDHTEVYLENKKKRKRTNNLGLKHPQSN